MQRIDTKPRRKNSLKADAERRSPSHLQWLAQLGDVPIERPSACSPASQQIGITVARWRERDATAAALAELLPSAAVAEDEPGGFERGLAYGLALSMLLWIGAGIAAHVAGWLW